MKVFLSHNSGDRPAVEELARRLRDEGIEPWLDKWNLIPGDPWQVAIETALESCDGCLVFIGPSGIGPWQNEEMRSAIDHRVNEAKSFRVIPVLLPGTIRPDGLPSLLVAATWVEFRDTLNEGDAFHRLLSGVRGIAPGPGPIHEEPTGTPIHQLNAEARERLRNLAEPILASSDATRQFILACNQLPDALSAHELAKQIFESDEPMSFLRCCVKRENKKADFASDALVELSANICRLVEVVSPICFHSEDLHLLDQHVNKKSKTHANVQTRDRTVAASRVAFMKRISVKLDHHSDWQSLNREHLPGGGETVSTVPHPPELGIGRGSADAAEEFVNVFTEGLIRAVAPRSPTRAAVRATLKTLADYDEVFLCVLFDTRPAAANLSKLYAEFPQLILLVADQSADVSDAEESVLAQIDDIFKEFGREPAH